MNGRIDSRGRNVYTPKSRTGYFTRRFGVGRRCPWTRTRGGPWHPRHYHDVALLRSFYYGPGGLTTRIAQSQRCVVLALGVHLTEHPATPPRKPRHASGLVVHDGSLGLLPHNMQPYFWRLVRVRGPRSLLASPFDCC